MSSIQGTRLSNYWVDTLLPLACMCSTYADISRTHNQTQLHRDRMECIIVTFRRLISNIDEVLQEADTFCSQNGHESCPDDIWAEYWNKITERLRLYHDAHYDHANTEPIYLYRLEPDAQGFKYLKDFTEKVRAMFA